MSVTNSVSSPVSTPHSSVDSSPISPSHTFSDNATGKVIDLDKITHELHQSVRRLSATSSLTRIQENTLQNILSNGDEQVNSRSGGGGASAKLPLTSEVLLMKYQQEQEEDGDIFDEDDGDGVSRHDGAVKAKGHRFIQTLTKLKKNISR